MKDGDKDEEIEFMDLEEGGQEAASTGNLSSKKAEAEDDWEEDNWEDEPEPMKPWTMALVFLGLVVLAAIICALLWRFTHGSDDQTPGVSATEAPVVTVSDEPTQTPEVQEPTQTPEVQEPTQEPGEQTAAPIEEPTATPEPQQTPTVTQTPAADVTAVPEEAEEQAPTDGDVSMSFNQVQESVTPKDVVNLRAVPSTADENTIVVQALNGEVLSRTGINPNTGWSRIDYNGQVLYAVTQYLTTDLSYKPPVQPSDPNRVTTVSGRVIIFTNCDDYLTPKEYVNLRTEPSTTEGDATVRCQVSNGESVHRTGYSPDSGWSRVEYNGEVLFVVTSLMQAP